MKAKIKSNKKNLKIKAKFVQKNFESDFSPFRIFFFLSEVAFRAVSRSIDFLSLTQLSLASLLTFPRDCDCCESLPAPEQTLNRRNILGVSGILIRIFLRFGDLLEFSTELWCRDLLEALNLLLHHHPPAFAFPLIYLHTPFFAVFVGNLVKFEETLVFLMTSVAHK